MKTYLVHTPLDRNQFDLQRSVQDLEREKRQLQSYDVLFNEYTLSPYLLSKAKGAKVPKQVTMLQSNTKPQLPNTLCEEIHEDLIHRRGVVLVDLDIGLDNNYDIASIACDAKLSCTDTKATLDQIAQNMTVQALIDAKRKKLDDLGDTSKLFYTLTGDFIPHGLVSVIKAGEKTLMTNMFTVDGKPTNSLYLGLLRNAYFSHM